MVEQERPETLNGSTIRVTTVFGSLFVTVNEAGPDHPFEIILNAGKTGSHLAADAQAIGRLCSLLLQFGSPVSHPERIELIIRTLGECTHPEEITEVQPSLNIPEALSVALRKYQQIKVLKQTCPALVEN